MKRPTQFARTLLWRYKKLWIILFGAIIILAYPFKLASESVSVSIVLDEKMYTKQQLTVDYNYNLEIFENIDEDSVNFSDIIISHIDEAENDIYIAMYSFNHERIKTSLFDAAIRGVNVHLIYNFERKKKLEEFLRFTTSYFDIKYLGEDKDEESFYHMHHKFMVIDPGSENEVLFTGPWNWSHHQEDLDFNILLKIKDSEIIDSYFGEYKRLEKGEGGLLKFSNWDYAPWEKEIIYPNGDKIELWWSPGRSKNSLHTRLVELVEEAESNIDIAVTILDSKPIVKKLKEKAMDGVKVRIIVDTNAVGNVDSVIPWLKNQIKDDEIENIEIYEGGRKPTDEQPLFSLLHYQNMIIDNKVVVTGTANWTHGGFFRNDENTLIFHSDKTSGIFSSIFEKYLDYLLN